MKLTPTLLKKLIAEEMKRARLSEGPEGFYSKKADRLRKIADHVSGIGALLEQMASDESRAPAGEVEDITALQDSIESFGFEVDSLLEAVEPMIDMMGESRGRGRTTLKESHARITAEEISAWKSGDWGYDALAEAAEAPKCAECGRKMSKADKDAYEAEGGKGYPKTCEDCAEMP